MMVVVVQRVWGARAEEEGGGGEHPLPAPRKRLRLPPVQPHAVLRPRPPLRQLALKSQPCCVSSH
eukprot:1150953-Rhodomonas_salina.1